MKLCDFLVSADSLPGVPGEQRKLINGSPQRDEKGRRGGNKSYSRPCDQNQRIPLLCNDEIDNRRRSHREAAEEEEVQHDTAPSNYSPALPISDQMHVALQFFLSGDLREQIVAL